MFETSEKSETDKIYEASLDDECKPKAINCKCAARRRKLRSNENSLPSAAHYLIIGANKHLQVPATLAYITSQRKILGNDFK